MCLASCTKVIDGRQYNLNEQLGLPEDSSLQSLVGCLGINDTEGGAFRLLKRIRQRTAFEAFWKTESVICHFVTGPVPQPLNPCLQKITWHCTECETGDVTAVNYVLTAKNITAWRKRTGIGKNQTRSILSSWRKKKSTRLSLKSWTRSFAMNWTGFPFLYQAV